MISVCSLSLNIYFKSSTPHIYHLEVSIITLHIIESFSKTVLGYEINGVAGIILTVCFFTGGSIFPATLISTTLF